MNLQQLEYIVALDRERHFVKASEACFVTQATLSMMIRKLEEELEVQLFDRDKKPVQPTREGEAIINRARSILAEAKQLKDFARNLKGDLSGELRLAIIPTLAPYLLPLFLKSFSTNYPKLHVHIKEMVTSDIIQALQQGSVDIGILATPLEEKGLTEDVLFYEEFLAYASRNEKLPGKKYVLPKQIEQKHLWLLEEGHCFRNQVLNLCHLRRKQTMHDNVEYEAGSIETLINLVDRYDGVTVVPRLAELKLNPKQKANIREFAEPKPAREISLVYATHYARLRIVDALKKEILSHLPPGVQMKRKQVLDL